MYNPFGSDAGNEWVELYHRGGSSINGWTISNRNGTEVVALPDWDIPDDCYLVVYSGNGINDSDFSDNKGSLYTGIDIEFFNNIEDEVAIYSDIPSPSTIVDFVSWCSDNDYNQGQAHDYAVNARIWDSGHFFDTGFPNGEPVWDGISIGRDEDSIDSNQPEDWDTNGGTDGYYVTPGVRNGGPLYSIYDGIKLTQLRANLLLLHWDYQVTYGSHTILEEYQTDDETYVKAEHTFEANLDGGVSQTFTGEAEYRWYTVNSSAWAEEINFLLSTPDLHKTSQSTTHGSIPRETSLQ